MSTNYVVEKNGLRKRKTERKGKQGLKAIKLEGEREEAMEKKSKHETEN